VKCAIINSHHLRDVKSNAEKRSMLADNDDAFVQQPMLLSIALAFGYKNEYTF